MTAIRKVTSCIDENFALKPFHSSIKLRIIPFLLTTFFISLPSRFILNKTAA